MGETRVFLCIFLLFRLSTAANILGLSSIASPSHHNWNRNIYYKLAAQGHNLTVLSADVDTEGTPGLHYIWAEQVYPSLLNGTEKWTLEDAVAVNPFLSVLMYHWFIRVGCAGFHQSQGFKTLLNYPEDFKFDLVIMDYTMEPCLLGFLHKFKYPPTVGISAFSVPPYTYEFIGGFVQPSYVPHYNALFQTEMNFIERVENFLIYGLDTFARKYILFPGQEEEMKKAFNEPHLPKFNELTKNIILVLVNTHFSLERSEPLPPNIIPVAGLQIQPPKPLEPSLAAFADTNKGLILFSLGTNLKSDTMDDARKKIFIDAFTQLKEYNFIWKYESDLGIPLPANVKTLGWVRQNDILAHPKTKAFISHCGMLGTQEAAWYGIPIVGIPFFADQHRNIQAGIREGTSVKVDFGTLTVESIKSALLEVLEDPKYMENAKKRANLFRDQPDKPIDRASFWIEWVLRHKDNYASLKLPVKDLGVFVANSYDVILFLVLMGVTIPWFGVWICVKMCCKKKKVIKEKKQ